MDTEQKRAEENSMLEKRYLGDGVYLEVTEHDLVMYTSDGIKATNRIVLEPQVLANLMEYLNKAFNTLKKEKGERHVDKDEGSSS